MTVFCCPFIQAASSNQSLTCVKKAKGHTKAVLSICTTNDLLISGSKGKKTLDETRPLDESSCTGVQFRSVCKKREKMTDVVSKAFSCGCYCL